MYIIIAKIRAEYKIKKSEYEAFRVIDTDTKETKIISRSILRKAVLNGVNIVGMKKDIKINLLKEKVGNGTRLETASAFSINKTPEINGNGELVNQNDNDLLTIYGFSGFAEAKKYYCFNYAGKIKILDVVSFKNMVIENKINGAYFDKGKNHIVIDNRLNQEIIVRRFL